MKPRWSYAAVALGILLLAAVPLFHSRVHHDIAMLERLAPRIERAQLLAPETREAITRLLDRVNQSASDTRHDARRQRAVERVAAALKAKAAARELSSIGQRPDN
jgi:hypothetical protein